MTYITTITGTGINGLEVVSSTLAANFTVTTVYSNVPGAGMAQVSTVECVVNTLANEQVLISFTGNTAQLNSGDEGLIGYQIDSGTAVVCGYNSVASANYYPPINFTVMSAPLAAGAHTIKLMAAKGGSDTFIISGGSNLQPSVFQVARFKSKISRMAPDKKVADDAGAANVTVEHIIFQAQEAVTVTKAFYLPDAALTADDTNYATLIVYRRDSSGGTQASIASKTTKITGGGSNDWTAFDGVDLGTLTNTAIAAGQVITWEITKTLAGVVVPAGTLQIEYTVD